MKRKIIALAISTFMAVASIGSVAADQPPGLRGYEGQPGHQAGQQHNGPHPGLSGYEGQPGNQGGQQHNGPAPGQLGYEGQPGNQSH